MTDSPVFARLHSFLLWLMPLTLKLPRHQRFVMAQRLQALGFELQSCLMRASRIRPAEPALRLADATLLDIRACLRLAHDLSWVSPGQYETGAKHCVELGRLVGAWLKKS